MPYEDFLEAKYGTGGPGGDRFKREVGEYHASQIMTCERKLYWAFEKGTTTDSSSFKYFELGRLHEQNFGAVLAWEYGDFTQEDLRKLSNDELIEQCDVVQQDVEFEIDCGDFEVVGESDWVVFEDEPFDKILVDEDGDRTVLVSDKVRDFDDDHQVKLVVETKTTGAVKWKHKYGADEPHIYQLYAYMHAMQADGEVAYIERNDLSMAVFEQEYDPDIWMDCMIRLKSHHANLQSDELPETTPYGDYECKYCDFRAECMEEGGKVWD